MARKWRLGSKIWKQDKMWSLLFLFWTHFVTSSLWLAPLKVEGWIDSFFWEFCLPQSIRHLPPLHPPPTHPNLHATFTLHTQPSNPDRKGWILQIFISLEKGACFFIVELNLCHVPSKLFLLICNLESEVWFWSGYFDFFSIGESELRSISLGAISRLHPIAGAVAVSIAWAVPIVFIVAHHILPPPSKTIKVTCKNVKQRKCYSPHVLIFPFTPQISEQQFNSPELSISMV